MTSFQVSLKKFQGCLVASAMGDALCASREGGYLERLLWRIIGKTSNGLHRYTDDTQMSMDLARHLLRYGSVQQDELAREFAASYRWSRGYGPGAAMILKKIRDGVDWRIACRARYPTGSFGNGAAMRIPVLALFYQDRPHELKDAVELSSVITHAHPAAIMGAMLMALAVIQALSDVTPVEAISSIMAECNQEDFLRRMTVVQEYLSAGIIPDSGSLRRTLGTGISAIDSCPASILIGMFYRNHPLDHLISYVKTCKGDTDTIGAMAASIWGAYNGIRQIPAKDIASIENHAELLDIASSLYAKYPKQG